MKRIGVDYENIDKNKKVLFNIIQTQLMYLSLELKNLLCTKETKNYKYNINSFAPMKVKESDIDISDTFYRFTTINPIIFKGTRTSKWVNRLTQDIEIELKVNYEIKRSMPGFEIKLNAPKPTEQELVYGGFNKKPGYEESSLLRTIYEKQDKLAEGVSAKIVNAIQNGWLDPTLFL